MFYLPGHRICDGSHPETNHGFEPRPEDDLSQHVHDPVAEARVHEHSCRQSVNLILLCDFVWVPFEFMDYITVYTQEQLVIETSFGEGCDHTCQEDHRVGNRYHSYEAVSSQRGAERLIQHLEESFLAGVLVHVLSAEKSANEVGLLAVAVAASATSHHLLSLISIVIGLVVTNSMNIRHSFFLF